MIVNGARKVFERRVGGLVVSFDDEVGEELTSFIQDFYT